jgi:hypothetical protein
MGLEVQSLDELNPDLVEQSQAEFSELLQERYPEVELSRGVVHDVVAFLAGGVSGGVNQTEVNRVLEARSLLAIQENPELNDPEIVDAVLSNYMISRQIGTRAVGELTLVYEGDTSVVLSANAAYFAAGLEFRVDLPIVAIPPGNTPSGPGQRVLSPRGDGSYEFTVPITAVDVGAAGNLKRNTQFVPEAIPIRFVTSFAANDLIGGSETEDNDSLITRLDEGIPAKVMQGRQNIIALLKDQTVFADTLHYSIIGYGDPEMERDQHWIFPVSGGGRVDIYARTNETPRGLNIRKDCVLVDKPGTDGIWQFTLRRDDAPGFYQVEQVRRPDDPTDVAGFAVTSDERGYDFGDDTFRPDIQHAVEAAYTRYQTAVIRFLDTETSVDDIPLGTEAEYVVAVQTMPLIAELQIFSVSLDHSNLMADVLVKAAVPCFLSINCDIIKDVDETAPLLDPIKNDLAVMVNNLDFPGVLYASQVTDLIHNYLSGSMAVGLVDMHGMIRRPDGTMAVIRDKTELWIPESPSTLVTPRTTTFILYAEDIGLNVVNRGA